MPADEVHHEGFAGEPRARTGPRHAAPRKPLLTRLQVPAGKAIAIAAMPTAVLMGMGLTPTLAQAKPGVPDNPFQDGPCVTAPDKDAESDAEKDAAAKAKEEAAKKAAKDAKDAKGSDEAKGSDKGKGEDGKDEGKKDGAEKPDPSTPPSSGDKADPDDKAGPTDPSTGEKDGAEEPEKTPEPTKTKNPWDPLGVGDALKDVFTPDKDKDEAKDEAEKEPESPAPSGSKSTSPEDALKDTTDKVTKPVDDTVGKLGDGVKDGVKDGLKGGLKDGKDTADDEADKLKEKADKLKEAAEKAAKDAAKDKAEDSMAPDENGKKPFPCVVEKKVDGDVEKPPSPIPNQPWNLEASSLTLKGADYQGVVNLTMPNGRSKQALKYVVQNTDIGDLHQIVEGPAGKKYHVEAAKGSTSTIRGGETTMYTERISGKLFGLIPITFDPEHPPPLNIPLIHFTDVKVQQAGQFGGNLTIPGLHQSITD
ncbi:hypothetical protein ABZ953_15255 [Streptomyces sp. NPDC046465]|uniref:hypothetical protein n=1 Tax=Streptomyces sp. NPDC046465 TaxID=3155810 RepID=UPI0033D5529F